MRNATRLLVLTLAAGAASLHAQTKEQLASIQRDIADMEDQIKQIKKAQDEKMEALTALVQQALGASSNTSASLATLQKTLSDSLNASLSDQQKKIVEPVAELRTRVDEMTRDFSGLRETVADLSTRLGRMEGKLNDIYTAVTTPPVPPPAATVPNGTATNGVPPGVTAVGLRQDAERDLSGGRYEIALDEFAKYIQYFPLDAYSPTAQFHIAEIYDRNGQYDDAAKAYDKVVEQFPRNERTVDAAYYKAWALQKAGKRKEAVTEFNKFIVDYPNSDHIAQAKTKLRELGAAAPATSPRGRKGR